MHEVRLQVALAKAGIASRRKAAQLIESHRVKVNGIVINRKGFRVDTARDVITVDGTQVSAEGECHYYVLHKPRGVLSTVRDERGRRTVLDLMKDTKTRIYPVGRLDKETTGLIILTNDGDLTYKLAHPKFKIDRVYEVKVNGAFKKSDSARLLAGVVIDGKTARAEKIVFRKATPSTTALSLTLREGRKREVRKMFAVLGYMVLELKRVAFGPLRLQGIKEGQSRSLTKTEIIKLKMCVGIPC